MKVEQENEHVEVDLEERTKRNEEEEELSNITVELEFAEVQGVGESTSK